MVVTGIGKAGLVGCETQEIARLLPHVVAQRVLIVALAVRPGPTTI